MKYLQQKIRQWICGDYKKVVDRNVETAKDRGYKECVHPDKYWAELSPRTSKMLDQWICSEGYRIYFYNGEKRITWHHIKVQS